MRKPETPSCCSHNYDYDVLKLKRQITIRLNNGNIVIPVEQILYLEADVNYTLVHTQSNEKYISSRTMKHYEACLDKNVFIRVHKSHIVNLSCIERLEIGKKCGEIMLKGGEYLEVSRRKLKAISQRMDIKQIF